jgi:hypothetical protein
MDLNKQDLRVSFRIPNKDFKWEPVVRQYIKLERGIIIEQEKAADAIHFTVCFENEESLVIFSDNLSDIGIKMVS